MSLQVALAADGGNSKTDLALVRSDGRLLALVRGPASSPHYVGFDGCEAILAELLGQALEKAGLPADWPVADVAHFQMAGVDFPAEEETLQAALDKRGWATRTSVGNDTFAVLRAGSTRPWGVGVVCGSGINCVGVSPDGRHVRFPSLGWISGDWGGGGDVGQAAVSAAARSEDGRGPVTSLEKAVPAHFGLTTPLELTEAFHQGRIPQRRSLELTRVVFAEAATDAVAAAIIARVADEVLAMVRVALDKLDLTRENVDVVLGGGLFQSGDELLVGLVTAGLAEIGSGLVARTAQTPPIVGAALLGLDDLGAGREAEERLRVEMKEATDEILATWYTAGSETVEE